MTQQIVIENDAVIPMILKDAWTGLSRDEPLWGDDAVPPNGTVIQPGDSVALEVTLAHLVTIELAEPDTFLPIGWCDDFRPTKFDVSANGIDTTINISRRGTLKIVRNGTNSVRIVSGSDDQRKLPDTLTAGCPVDQLGDHRTFINWQPIGGRVAPSVR